MRGCAAFAVLFFHFFYKGPTQKWIVFDSSTPLHGVAQYGYLGVHLFFMISGFVISMSAQKATARGFALSRAARLFPALWICAVLTTVVLMYAPTSFFKASWLQLIINLTLVPHWFGVAPIDGSYWSLVVEVHFYIAVFVLVLFRKFQFFERVLYVWIFLSAINFLRPMHPLQLWLNVNWAPLLASGALFFYVREYGWTLPRKLGLACCLGLAILYEIFHRDASTIQNRIVTTTLITVFFVLFTAIVSRNSNLKPSKTSDFLGKITYPLYLLHQNIGYALYASLAAFIWAEHEMLRMLIITAVILLVAYFINQFFEKPLARLIRRV